MTFNSGRGLSRRDVLMTSLTTGLATLAAPGILRARGDGTTPG